MTDWLERAKREFVQSADPVTANTAERNPTAVTAVPDLSNVEILRASIGSNGSAPVAASLETETAVPMTAGDDAAIRAWLAHIGERDEAIIAHMLSQCSTDADARGYFIRRAGEVPRPHTLDDDRRCCDQCANLTQRGLCLAARRGEIVSTRAYEPMRDLARRCECYAPGPDDLDRRPGRERWPGLNQKGCDDANT